MVLIKPKQLGGLPGFEFTTEPGPLSYSGPKGQWQDALVLQTNKLRDGYVYRVGYTYQWRYSSSARDIRVQILADNVLVRPEFRAEPKDPRSDQSLEQGGFFYLGGEDVSVELKIQFTNTKKNDTARIQSLYFEIWQVGAESV